MERKRDTLTDTLTQNMGSAGWGVESGTRTCAERRNAPPGCALNIQTGNRGKTRRSTVTYLAEEYRARADACVDRALQAINPAVRFEFMEMARQWHALADDAEAIADASRQLAERSRRSS